MRTAKIGPDLSRLGRLLFIVYYTCLFLNSIYFFHRFYYKLAFPEFNYLFQFYCIVVFEGELTSFPLKNKE